MGRYAEKPDWERLVFEQSRPAGRSLMRQTWSNLLFAHAPVAGSLLEPLIPPGLELELYDGFAWLGFVPFQMKHVRPSFMPKWGLRSSFLETNFRTYVRHPEHGPGVWFFSLDASDWPACFVARSIFKLPYYFGAMYFERKEDQLLYAGTRQKVQRLPLVYPKPLGLETYDAKVRVHGEPQMAEPETFEFWLLERYRLYAADYRGNLMTGKVHHTPYQVRQVEVQEISVRGIKSFDSSFSHFVFAESVDIEAFKPYRV